MLLRPLALAAAAAGPTLALIVTGRGQRDAVTAARAYSALVGVGLRILEVAPGVEHPWLRAGLIQLARIVAGWGEQASRLGPGGNRQAFVLQQHAEVNLLAAIYRGLPPAPNLAQQLQSLRDSYRNGATSAAWPTPPPRSPWQHLPLVTTAKPNSCSLTRSRPTPTPAPDNSPTRPGLPWSPADVACSNASLMHRRDPLGGLIHDNLGASSMTTHGAYSREITAEPARSPHRRSP